MQAEKACSRFFIYGGPDCCLQVDSFGRRQEKEKTDFYIDKKKMSVYNFL